MDYQPFDRGSLPVGVITRKLDDDSRSRSLPTEIWYPAVDSVRGKDVGDDADEFEVVPMPGFPKSTQLAVRDAPALLGSFPLVVFSHGFGSHRRQSTFLCTHLASHGYVVAAPDHIGNTVRELMAAVMGGTLTADGGSIIGNRPLDISVVIDALATGPSDEITRSIDRDRVALVGHSYGGWTAIATAGRESRVGVIVALAPAGGRDSIGYAALKEATKLDWQRVIPTLVLAADRDSILPIGGIRDLYADIRAPKKMFVLENAGHMHFCDDADRIHELFRLMPGIGEVVPSATPTPPFSELCPADHGYDFTKALTLAHFDAFVKGRDHAKELLTSGVAKLLAERGIAFEQI